MTKVKTTPKNVIPAKAGIHTSELFWVPASAGMTPVFSLFAGDVAVMQNLFGNWDLVIPACRRAGEFNLPCERQPLTLSLS